MKKIDADKKLIEMLESYDYEYCGNFEYEFHLTKTGYGTTLTIIMHNGYEGDDREYAYRVEMTYFPEDGQVVFQVDSDGFAFGMGELEFFTNIAEDRKKIMSIYNSIDED